MRRLWLLLIPFLIACPRGERKKNETREEERTSAPARPNNSARLSKKAEGAALLKWMQESQRQALVGQDLQAFMRIWADDARLISCRSAGPGPYDEVIPIKRIQSYWKARGHDDRSSIEVSFDKERVRIKGSRATVTWETTVKETHRVTKEVAIRVENESWLLRRKGDGWLVFDNRVWPIKYQRGSNPMKVYDAAEWARLDDAVEQAKKSKDIDALLPALFDAQRYGEGHDEAVQATARVYPSESRWFWRGAFAVSLYFVDDARLAFREQLALNDTADIPNWARSTVLAPSAPVAPR